MTTHEYDAIIVGARCAGSPTAMLLARQGHKVLLVDKATFPSDTISTHLIHPPGVATLRRWGLLDRVVATGCPPIDTYLFDFGPFTITGSPGTSQEPVSYAPRRTVLDKILLDAAVEAGAEVREGFTVEEVLRDGDRVTGVRGRDRDRTPVTETARVVIGADGFRSVVAEAMEPEQYNEVPPLAAAYYTYWSNLPMEGRFEAHVRPGRAFAAWPTNDGLTLAIAGWPMAEFEENKRDIEGHYRETIGIAPEFAGRMQSARREERFFGIPLPNFFRKPFGPGWALVGDAGCTKDSITAQGIQDAFRDAENAAAALHQALSGTRPFEEALGEWQRKRDEHIAPMYRFTTQLAALEPPPPRQQQVLAAVSRNQDSMDAFARMNAGVTSPAEFFSEENIGRILSAAG